MTTLNVFTANNEGSLILWAPSHGSLNLGFWTGTELFPSPLGARVFSPPRVFSLDYDARDRAYWLECARA